MHAPEENVAYTTETSLQARVHAINTLLGSCKYGPVNRNALFLRASAVQYFGTVVQEKT